MFENKTRIEATSSVDEKQSAPDLRYSDDQLEAIRRLDWRFLLSDPNLGHVCYLGHSHGRPLLQALKQYSRRVTEWKMQLSMNGTASTGQFDILVGEGFNSRELREAATKLKNGGFLFLELQRRLSLGSCSPLVKQIEQLGFEQVRLHWHHPDFESCQDIVPLESKNTLTFLFRRNRGSLKGALIRIAGRLLVVTGMHKRLLLSVSIIAQKQGGSQTTSRNILGAYLKQKQDADALSSPGDVLNLTTAIATPRFKASGHLIFFVMRPHEVQPFLIAKVPRFPGDHRRLEREAENLRELQNRWPDGVGSFPKLQAYEHFRGHALLIETAVPGQTMRPSFVRRHRDKCLELGINWLSRQHNATRRSRFTHETVASGHFLSQLETLTRSSEEDLEAINVTRDFFDSVDWKNMPTVIEHRDFSSPNLLISDEGDLGVVDWELADTSGLPGIDLFFFLTYISFATAGASKREECLFAFTDAFFGRTAWANKYISQYWDDLDLSSRDVTALFIISWGRYVAGLVERLKDTASTGFSDETLAWLRRNRYYHMWKYALQNLDKLNLLTR